MLLQKLLTFINQNVASVLVVVLLLSTLCGRKQLPFQTSKLQTRSDRYVDTLWRHSLLSLTTMSNHVRAFGHRGVELEKLCTESADGLHRLEETFQEFVKARWEQHGAEQTSKKWRFSVERERDTLKKLQEEKLLWDSVLETKQKEVKDLKKVIKKDV